MARAAARVECLLVAVEVQLVPRVRLARVRPPLDDRRRRRVGGPPLAHERQQRARGLLWEEGGRVGEVVAVRVVHRRRVPVRLPVRRARPQRFCERRGEPLLERAVDRRWQERPVVRRSVGGSDAVVGTRGGQDARRELVAHAQRAQVAVCRRVAPGRRVEQRELMLRCGAGHDRLLPALARGCGGGGDGAAQ